MNTHRIKGNGTVIALILAMAAPVQASAVDRLPKRMLSASDRAAIFGVDSRFQVALLSEDEMAETKGALWPFVGNWIRRLRWGGYYGALHYGWVLKNSPYEHGSYGRPRLMGEFIVMTAVVGLLSTSPAIGGAVGFTAERITAAGGPSVSIDRLRSFIDRRGWTLTDLLNNVGEATDRVSANRLQNGGDGGAVPESMERTSESIASRSLDSRRFLISLTDTLDRGALRGFLSGLPSRLVNYWLAMSAPEMSREDFLANLPADTVNHVLLKLSEEQMSRFVEDVVPQYIRDAIFPTSPTSVHWVY